MFVKNISVSDVNCSLFIRRHFTIGCYNRRRTSRCRHGFQFSGIQNLFADHVHRRTWVHNKFSFLPKVRRMLLFLAPLILRYFWPVSTLLHGHIALAIPSLLESDPQVLGRWDCADEDHLDKSFQAMDFGLECWRNAIRLLVNRTHRIGFSVFESSAKSMKTSVLLCIRIPFLMRCGF